MFGGIAKLVGGLVDGASGRGSIAHALEKALRDLTASGVATSGLAALAQNLTAGNPLANVDKLAYLAVLNGAIKKASESGSFNLETHVNDLWVSLSTLRSNATTRAQLQDLVQKRQELVQEVQKLLERFNQGSQSIIQNLR